MEPEFSEPVFIEEKHLIGTMITGKISAQAFIESVTFKKFNSNHLDFVRCNYGVTKRGFVLNKDPWFPKM